MEAAISKQIFYNMRCFVLTEPVGTIFSGILTITGKYLFEGINLNM